MQLTQQPTVNTFAEALRRARQEAGLSQRGLAKRCGLTPAYLSLLEGGRRMPERPTVERIAAALELDEEAGARLMVAAGYAPAGGVRVAPAGPLAEVEALLTDAGVTPAQRSQIALLVRLYVEGLVARVRAGQPLVANLAAPWQQRILEAMQEKMREDFEAFREGYMRPSFDL
jgi:transcriptional regulator with XRE-family HTH domain